MSTYKEYIKQIDDRKKQGLNPKPIDDASLLEEIISQIKDINHEARKASIDFFIYNVIPGTTSAAYVKASFLKDIIDEAHSVEEISPDFAFELLSHMKGGPSVKILIDYALSDDSINSQKAADILKTQVYLYEADMDRLEHAYNQGNKVAEDILISYSKAEFFYTAASN